MVGKLRMHKIIKGTAVVLMAGTMLAGCGKTRMTRGYYFDPILSTEILPGVDTQQSVSNTLGSPSTFGAWNTNTWYYISTNLRFRAVLHPKRESRRIMAVTFSEDGYVDTVKNLDLSVAWEIKPEKDKTRTRGRELNLMQQLFMNVGRFAGADGAGGISSPNGGGPNGS